MRDIDDWIGLSGWRRPVSKKSSSEICTAPPTKSLSDWSDFVLPKSSVGKNSVCSPCRSQLSIRTISVAGLTLSMISTELIELTASMAGWGIATSYCSEA